MGAQENLLSAGRTRFPTEEGIVTEITGMLPTLQAVQESRRDQRNDFTFEVRPKVVGTYKVKKT